MSSSYFSKSLQTLYLQIGDSFINPTNLVRNLVVTFDNFIHINVDYCNSVLYVIAEYDNKLRMVWLDGWGIKKYAKIALATSETTYSLQDFN